MEINISDFLCSNSDWKKCPKPNLPEYAFIGRSNVGKSSLINALTNSKKLAKTSGKPGKTQLINHFFINNSFYLADLPGYGYAKVSKTQVAAWTRTLKSFLKGRVTLRRVCLLIDSRIGLKDLDREMMDMLDSAAVVYQVVFTKVDKLKNNDLMILTKKTTDELNKRSAAFPTLAFTSSNKLIGIGELRAGLASLSD